MKYLLDTNVCIRFLNGRSIRIRDRLHALPMTDIVLCSVVKSELEYGLVRRMVSVPRSDSQRVFVEQFVSLPFDDRAAMVAARLRHALESTGKPIGPYDVQIAAIALANQLTLVTHNTREFARVPDLQLDDWEA